LLSQFITVATRLGVKHLSYQYVHFINRSMADSVEGGMCAEIGNGGEGHATPRVNSKAGLASKLDEWQCVRNLCAYFGMIETLMKLRP